MQKGVFSWRELLDSRREKRPLIAGIVNVTPDSFSDGKGSIDPQERIEFALQLLDEGADILDLGGESTRPGAAEIAPEEEFLRLEAVLNGILAVRPDAIISIDTRHAATAERTLAAGAKIINDVSGLAFDAAMAEVAVRYSAGAILTHSTGIPALMQQATHVIESNAVKLIGDELHKIVKQAENAGISKQQLMLDVGIGFGKSRAMNYSLLHHAQYFEQHFDLPFCWGVSRKSLLRMEPDSMAKRIAGSLALAVKLADMNVSLLRVHDVAQTIAALTAARELDSAL